MATKKQPELNEANVQSCLVIVRQLYADYTPEEITQALIINRAEIEAVKQRIRLEAELADIQDKLKKLPPPVDKE